MPIPLPTLVVSALVIVSALAAIAMAASNRVTRRIGFATTVLSVVTVLAAWSIEVCMLALLTGLLWLFGRGIPGNRRRPAWVWALAGLTAVSAVVCLVGLVTDRG